MKICALNFCLPKHDAQDTLEDVLTVIIEAFKELNEEENVALIKARNLELTFFDGTVSKAMIPAVKTMIGSDGVIFAVPSFDGAPNALCAAFFENLSAFAARDVLREKNCFVVSSGGGVRSCQNVFSSMLARFGAFDAVRFAFEADSAADESLKILAEKMAEDYYRIMRQNRKYYVPPIEGGGSSGGELALEDIEKMANRPRKTLSQLMEERKVEATEKTDADEVAQLFVEKFAKSDNANLSLVGKEPSPLGHNIEQGGRIALSAKVKTVKQMTFSLPHKYKPQLAQGLNTVIQFVISGVEQFACYITISNIDCDVAEGEVPNPDLTIIADSAALADVLKGRYTSQKAFMTGRLKVRGNFTILTHFDRLFDFNIN